MSELDRDAQRAYDTAARAWASGPARVYRALAVALLDAAPVPLRGARLLDVGAGTGVLCDVAAARGARCVEVDVAVDMLATSGGRARTTVAADGRRLPFPPASFDVVTAACSLSHVPDPADVLGDARRVLGAAGVMLASAFSASETAHPARTVIDGALRDRGWTPPGWYGRMMRTGEAEVDTPEALVAHARSAGFTEATADVHRVHTGVASPDELIEWRLGVAQYAEFLERLDASALAELRDHARRELGDDPPPLVRLLVVLSARG